ncbi:MBL fold metallo-hydrolase [Bergeyella sp. RCAD1439]|uniref:MBL fold metallo-hydrolase n=1 Tax=Bergeyella anatis TaxID=3113737 RepID=UPI002E1879CC|nr:MBL fold metallo-hydrolase [Bergeyella sp. RCAD1439]
MLAIESFTFNPFSENTYVLYNEQKTAAVVDPGNLQPHETQALEAFVTRKGLAVRHLLLTHAHIDHVFGLQWCHDRFGIGVRLHPDEKEILDRNPMTAGQYGFFFPPFSGEVSFLSEGEVIRLDEDELVVHHVPGHSPGHVAFHCVRQGFVVSGDVLFRGSIGRTDLYKGNADVLLESIRTKLFVLPEATEVFPGHGTSTTVGEEKRFNPFFVS